MCYYSVLSLKLPVDCYCLFLEKPHSTILILFNFSECPVEGVSLYFYNKVGVPNKGSRLFYNSIVPLSYSTMLFGSHSERMFLSATRFTNFFVFCLVLLLFLEYYDILYLITVLTVYSLYIFFWVVSILP